MKTIIPPDAFVFWGTALSFVLSLFGVQTAFISLPTQTGNSSGAMIGLAINAISPLLG